MKGLKVKSDSNVGGYLIMHLIFSQRHGPFTIQKKK